MVPLPEFLLSPLQNSSELLIHFMMLHTQAVCPFPIRFYCRCSADCFTRPFYVQRVASRPAVDGVGGSGAPVVNLPLKFVCIQSNLLPSIAQRRRREAEEENESVTNGALNNSSQIFPLSHLCLFRNRVRRARPFFNLLNHIEITMVVVISNVPVIMVAAIRRYYDLSK